MSSNLKKKKIIIIGICLILILILLIVGIFVPQIKFDIIGNPSLTIEVGTEYNDSGAKAYIENIFGKKEISVTTINDVDSTKLGKYKITYIAKAKGMIKKETRNIKVVDTTPPEINIPAEIKACKNNKTFNINAQAEDKYDGDLTNEIKYHVVDDIIYLNVSDSSHNEKKTESKLIYIDSEKPEISLNGSATIYLTLNESYVEYGATAVDSCDGDISKNIKISGKVDNTKEGTYFIKYQVKDSFGNDETITRKIIVSSTKTSKVTNGNIYLTFDDGPGQYTASYLDLLAKYDIKATFFVTGQFPKYFDLITREYEEGHTIGIHTYSHKWNIYESIDTYLEDFQKIEKVIYEKTNYHPQYFRFPGGSSNTISRRYCQNIMTDLSKIMTEEGYTYFDWTFDSGDTVKGKNTKTEIVKTVKSYLKGNGNYIILMHDLKKSSLEALPEIIEYALKQGYEFKKIDENTPIAHFKIAN